MRRPVRRTGPDVLAVVAVRVDHGPVVRVLSSLIGLALVAGCGSPGPPTGGLDAAAEAQSSNLDTVAYCDAFAVYATGADGDPAAVEDALETLGDEPVPGSIRAARNAFVRLSLLGLRAVAAATGPDGTVDDDVLQDELGEDGRAFFADLENIASGDLDDGPVADLVRYTERVCGQL